MVTKEQPAAEIIAELIDQAAAAIAARRRTEARSAEETAQRQRYADQAGDRETPGHLVSRDGEADAQEVRVEDQRHDRDGGTGRDTGMTLGERIEAEVQRRREARGEGLDSGDDRGGRSR